MMVGQKQPDSYIKRAPELDVQAEKGTTLLPALNWVTLRDLDLGKGLHVDITLRTYPGDPNHVGMVYYELTNPRMDYKEVAHEVSVALGILLTILGIPLPTPVSAPVPVPVF
jgi:hypothetical protein